MIDYVEKLIEELVKKEKEFFSNFDVGGHAPTIGEMYEELTEKISNVSLESIKGLRVSCGFIVDNDKNISGEIDCMIVFGKGQKVPGRKNKYKYHVDNVLVVFEVKKTLNKKELDSSIKHLAEIINLKTSKEIDGKFAYHAYRAILKKEASIVNEKEESFESCLKNILIHESAYPLRIILSYGGYKTEKGLRDSFEAVFSENLGSKSYSLISLPHAVICDKYSILKLNGMPFAHYYNDTEWLGFASSGNAPYRILLELIWTRLTYLMGVPVEIFGDDLNLEQFSPLIRFKYLVGQKGFEAIPFDRSHSELAEPLVERKWEPVEISTDEWIFFQLLLKYDADISNEEVQCFFRDKLIDEVSFCQNLRDKNLGYLLDKKFHYLTDELKTVFLSNGKVYAADDSSGRFTNWINQQNKK